MEKTGTSSLDLEKIMPKTVGSTGMQKETHQELLAGKTNSHAEEKGNKGRKRT